jgi:hypothetical protein
MTDAEIARMAEGAARLLNEARDADYEEGKHPRGFGSHFPVLIARIEAILSQSGLALDVLQQATRTSSAWQTADRTCG